MTDETPKGVLEEGLLINEKWEIVSHIATGGKGEIYLANQRGLDRKVALKIISKAYLESLEDDHEGVAAEIERFRREVKILAHMRHPNIIQVFDFDQIEIDTNTFEYIVMEYVAGPDLSMTYPEPGLGQEEEAVKKWIHKYYLPILNGVEAVHAKGIIHRDLKPSNVLIAEDIPKIVDFGLAGGYMIDSVTRSCDIIGTLPYMPEEQLYGLSHMDVRSDIFALGRMLFEAIAGSLLKSKASPFQTVGLNTPNTPFFRRLDRIMRQATAKDQNKRTPSVKALRESLEELLKDVPGAKQKRSVHLWIWVALLSVALLAGGAIYHYHYMMPEPNVEVVSPAPDITPPRSEIELSKEDTVPLNQSTPSNQDAAVPREIVGKEGASMVLVVGGNIDMVDDAAKHTTIEVKTFYMDKMPITNYQYVEFLRKNKERLDVRGKAVYGDGKLWLLLGEVIEGYEPIAYKKGKFILKPEAAASPVVRITALGASAYASNYGRRLPSIAEWRLAQAESEKSMARPLEAAPSATGSTLALEPGPALKGLSPSPFPLSESTAKRFQITEMGAKVNEWTTVQSQTGILEYHVLGGIDFQLSAKDHYERQPWEAFPNVSFRTVTNP